MHLVSTSPFYIIFYEDSFFALQKRPALNEETSLTLRCCVPETDVNCVLWTAHIDFFIVTTFGSKNNGSSEGR